MSDTARRIILFNKPFRVLSQFTDPAQRQTLKHYIDIPDVRPAGRLDYDSEGLLVLTNDGGLHHRLMHPAQKVSKTYWVQVEGAPAEQDLEPLRQGIELKDGMTLPAKCGLLQAPDIWVREPPVRYRKTLPTSWLQVTLTEGRNRQVRRMCAAIGFPALRLVRYRVGSWTIDGLDSGQWLML